MNFICKKGIRLLVSLILSSTVMGSVVPGAVYAREPEQTTVQLDVGGGKMMLEAYADDIIRVRWSPNGEFVKKDFNDDEYITTFVDPDADLKPINMFVTEEGNSITASTDKIKVVIDKGSGKVSYYDSSGNLMLAEKERKKVEDIDTGDGKTYYKITQSFESPDRERLFGFGNLTSQEFGLKGNAHIRVKQDNTEKRTPMFVSNMGYGILFDITSNGDWDRYENNKTYVYTGKCTDSMDYYFFYGPEADEVISGYRKITGRAAMLPKNAFGYTQSRNRYESQKEVVDTAKMFRQKNIPLDTIVVDYHWYNSPFNNIASPNSSYSDMESMMEQLHENNVSASISIWPTFTKGDNPTYTEFAEGLPEGEDIILANGNGFGLPYDTSKKDYRERYWNLINKYVYSKGLDSIWLDANEPEMGLWRDDRGETTAFGSSRPIGLIYPLLDDSVLYKGEREANGDTKRVNTLSRGSVAGTQRYGIQSWSGDIQTGFGQMKKEILGTLNYSAAGLPYFSTDTGGYFSINVNDPNEREMFLRWLQFSAFSSIMRVHGRDSKREPWQFGSEYEKYITDYINLRERLIPYTYSLAGKVTQDGYTMVRPLVFDFRTDDTAVNTQDQFMFGPSVMAAPVTDQGARSREVYLPAGTWINFWTGESITSTGKKITADAPLTQMPLYIKAGSIIPMAPFIQHANEKSDPTEIRVYQGEDGKFTLYEDEGDNYNYENGKFSEIPFEWNEESKTLTIGERSGSFDGMLENRTFNIVFVQKDYGMGIDIPETYQTSIEYDGSEVTVTRDDEWEPPLPPADPDTMPKPSAAPNALKTDKAMVGEWLFSEGEGLNVADTSGSFNPASMITTSTSQWAQGKNGYALNGEGTQTAAVTYAQAKDSASLDLTTGISFSAWIKPAENYSTHRFIINKGGNDQAYPGYDFFLRGGNVLQVEFQTNPAGSKFTYSPPVKIQDGEWSQVAFTWESLETGGDGKIRVYVNGGLIGTSDVFAGTIGTNGYPLNIGANNTSVNTAPLGFCGLIDECRLFNYGLSEADVKSMYDGESFIMSNPEDIVAMPEENGISLTWQDPQDDSLEGVKVSCVRDSSEDEPVEFDVPNGKQSLQIPDLIDGAYYHIKLTAYGNSRESYGKYVVGRAGKYKGSIEETLLYDKEIFGYLVNNTGAVLNGTLQLQVYKSGDTEPMLTKTLENVEISPMDMKQFRVEVGKINSAEKVILYFCSEEKEMLAEVKILYISEPENKLTIDYITRDETWISNYSQNSINGMLIAASYNSRDELIDVATQEIELAEGESRNAGYSINTDDAKYIKVFIWDNEMNKMLPLCNSAKLEL